MVFLPPLVLILVLQLSAPLQDALPHARPIWVIEEHGDVDFEGHGSRSPQAHFVRGSFVGTRSKVRVMFRRGGVAFDLVARV